jgi:hypothetical protein
MVKLFAPKNVVVVGSNVNLKLIIGLMRKNIG